MADAPMRTPPGGSRAVARHGVLVQRDLADVADLLDLATGHAFRLKSHSTRWLSVPPVASLSPTSNLAPRALILALTCGCSP